MVTERLTLPCRRLAALLLFACSLIAQGDPVEPPHFPSHVPLRPLPPLVARPLTAGPTFYVDAVKGRDDAAGTNEAPWRTVNVAFTRLSPGDTLVLRGGTYFERLYCAVAGTAEQPITIRAAPGERVIIDGGLPEFQTDAAKAWEPAAGGAPGEYVSTAVYKNIRDVVGLFGDSHIGLQTYWDPRDFRAENELLQYDAQKLPQPIYLGPGLWYEKAAGRIHVRLAPTHLKPSPSHNYAAVNYEGESDPRRLPLVIAPFSASPLVVDQAMHVRFFDLVFRGGAYRTVDLRFGVGLEFDRCVIYGGTYPVWSKGTGPLKMTHCGIYGMIPPWGTRWENGLFVYSPNKYPPFIPDEKGARHFSRLPTHALLVTEGGYEFEVFYYPFNHDWEIAHCEFSDSHDGVYLAGYNLRFHHNWLSTLQDDGIYVSAPTPLHNHSVYVYQNYLASGICSFGAHARGGPGGDVYIFRNVMDLRQPLHWGRPSEKEPSGNFMYGHSAFFMHDSGRLMHEEALHFYQNTCLLRSLYYAAAMPAYAMPDVPRRVFNNLFLYADQKPRAFGVKDPEKWNLQMDGNLHWHLTLGEAAVTPAVAAVRKLALGEAAKKVCPDGWEAHALVADPKCVAVSFDRAAVNDYRLQAESPANGAGLVLPAEYEDPLRPADGKRPEPGAFPAGAEPLRVGIGGRIVAGSLAVPP